MARATVAWISALDKVQDTETELLAILAAFEGRVPADAMKEMRRYITTHGEWGLAYDTLCFVLFQTRAAISKTEYDRLEQLGKQMELNEDLWTNLRSNG